MEMIDGNVSTLEYLLIPLKCQPHMVNQVGFSKVASTVVFSKISNYMHAYMYTYLYIYLYQKTKNSNVSFSQFCNHLNQIVEMSSMSRQKEKKKIERTENSGKRQRLETTDTCYSLVLGTGCFYRKHLRAATLRTTSIKRG